MAAIAVQSQRLAPQRLHNKIADYPTVIRKHPRAIGIEDLRHPYLHIIHSEVIETKGFSDALTFVVATAHTNRIDRAPVTLRLGMHLRVAVHLAGASEQQPRSHPPGKTKHVVCAQKTCLGSLDRIELIMNWRGWASQMPYPIHLQLDRLSDVMTDEFETGMTDPMGDVCLPPGEIVVEADHLLPSLHQPVDQMGAKEPGPPSDKVNLHAQGVRNASTIAAIPLSATVTSSP